jgi:hypothetical protein
MFERGGHAVTLQTKGDLHVNLVILRCVKFPSSAARRRPRPYILMQPRYPVEPSRLVDGSAHLPRKAPSWETSE